MKRLLVILPLLLQSCASEYVKPFQEPRKEQVHAVIQTESVRPNLLSIYKEATIEIHAINGQLISPRDEEERFVWSTPFYTKFTIPAGDTFIELKHVRNGDYGYIRFNSRDNQTYTISYQDYPDIQKFELVVHDAHGNNITSRTFRKRQWGEYVTPDKEDAMFDAIAMGNADRVRELLKKGANPNWVDASNHLDALSLVARENNMAILKLLIDAGVWIDSYNGYFALRLCAELGNLEMAEMLINHGADPNLRQFRWNSPLMEAAKHGHIQIVSLLLKHGAYTKFRNIDGKSALDLANDFGHQDIAQLLSR